MTTQTVITFSGRVVHIYLSPKRTIITNELDEPMNDRAEISCSLRGSQRGNDSSLLVAELKRSVY